MQWGRAQRPSGTTPTSRPTTPTSGTRSPSLPGERIRTDGHQVEVSADGALAAITGDSLWVIDLQTMTLQASVDLHGLPSEGLAISPDHARAYVAQPGQRTTVVDLERGVIESTMQTTSPAGQSGPANGGQADVALLPGRNTLLRSPTCCEVVAIMSVAMG